MKCVFISPFFVIEEDTSAQKCYRCAYGFPGDSVIKNPPANAGDVGSMLGLERFLRVGNGNPLQYSCLENSMDSGAWGTAVYGVAKSRTQLND